MSTSSLPNTVPKVRTYATDLNDARGRKGNPTVKPQPAPIAPLVKPTITDTASERVVPPFHSFTHSNKETPSKEANVTNQVIGASLTETQKVITENSNRSVGAGIKESLPAVIITDTKRKRFKLSEAIASGLGDWWSNKKEVAKKKKIPRYTVPEAERRKGVIQKATAKTGRTAAADHGAVITRIKATKQLPLESTTPTSVIEPLNTKPLQATQPSISPEKVIIQNPQVTLRQNSPRVVTPPLKVPTGPVVVGWETDIQTKVNALSEPAPVSNIVTIGKELSRAKQERSEVPEKVTSGTTPARVITPVIPQIQKTVAPPIRPVLPVETPIQPAQIVSTPLPPPPEITPIIQPDVARVVPTPITRSKITPIIPTALNKSPQLFEAAPAAVIDSPTTIPENTPTQTERRFAPPREEKRSIFSGLLQTNRIVFITFGVLIFVVVSGLSLRSYLQSSQTVATIPDNNTVDAVFPDTSIRSNTNLVSTPSDITQALQSEKSATDSLIEITFLNERGEILSPNDLITVLGANILFDFKSTMTSVAIGTYRESPWVVFYVSDKNTAFGGMLDWENNLYRDLSPIIGDGLAESRNRFNDDIIGTTDVRTLKNNNDEEVLVYGFIDSNTLLVTTNSTAFLNLAGKMY